MTRGYVRKVMLAVPALMFITAFGLAAQSSNSASPGDSKYLPAGPFTFASGAVHPTYMDAFDGRPLVKSPNGKLGVTVTGPKKSDEAWVTLSPSTFPDGPVQVWPIQRNVAVLWRSDSRAFALTDNRYANNSYVLVCGTEFRMGENGLGLGVPMTDLTPVVQNAFAGPARKYYGTVDYDTLLFYAKVLRWIGDDDLLVGISARTSGPTTFPNRGLKDWDFAYLVDVPNRKVIRTVDRAQLLLEYKITVSD